jgi:hypothetical protein
MRPLRSLQRNQSKPCLLPEDEVQAPFPEVRALSPELRAPAPEVCEPSSEVRALAPEVCTPFPEV